jgi:hypothetical protein
MNWSDFRIEREATRTPQGDCAGPFAGCNPVECRKPCDGIRAGGYAGRGTRAGREVSSVQVRAPDEFDSAFTAIGESNARAVLTVSGSFLPSANTLRARIQRRFSASCRVSWQDPDRGRRRGAAPSASFRTGAQIRELLPSVTYKSPMIPPPDSSQ